MRTFTENLGTALAAFVLVAGVMLLASPAAAQTVHPTSVSIQGGSLCVGVDCVTSETYNFDTIRLKENNLRIHFNDTSVGSFPTNDWRIVINSTASGRPAPRGFRLCFGHPTRRFHRRTSRNGGARTGWCQCCCA
jgi:hypothetical protein